MTYSLDYRRKVLSVREKEGLTSAGVAERFCVGVATVVRWLRRLDPQRTRYKPATKIAALARDVREYPDAYQAERAMRLGASAKGVGHALRRMNITYKKTLQHPKANVAARLTFRQRIDAYQAQGRTIVYSDESGFAHDMPRQYGYAVAGHRCYGQSDWNAKGRTNVIGALIGRLFLTVDLFKTNINADIFYQWTVQSLLPKLPPASVVVMDNATFHKRADIRDAIANDGHALDFLPAYSPDLNPIEKKWAHAKSIRRKSACSIQDLFKFKSFYVA
ncbi:MAG: Transposase [Rhodospirillaceae bacterium]|nr:MAG: Transposase [Rhodospirillaceae bacterium]